MLGRIWQWLKRFFQGLFGSNTEKYRHSQGRLREADSLQSLSDTDYEFLFAQLLEGVVRGWDQKRVLKFFSQLEDRTTQYEWIQWLEGFGAKVLASPASNQELGIRMIRFGQLTEFLPSLRRLGQESYDIGQKIINKHKKTPIWEFTSKEVSPSAPPPSPPQEEKQEFQPLTPDQLLARLYQDSQLAEELAKQLGLEGSNPEHIVAAMVNQMIQLQNKINSTETSTENNWLAKAVEQTNSGDLEGAIASCDQALSLNPNSVPGWHNRGSLLGNLGRLEEAIVCFQKVIELQPNDYIAYNALGNTFYKLERWQEAIAAWDKVTVLQKDYYQAWYNRACALEHLNRLPEAIESYEQALEIKPDFTLAQSRLIELRAKLTN